ncbi:MAG: hypothetical protein Q8O72_07710 [Bacteroidales bacterium]|nr:hypothetical protein [Bacteroidales bacterium]
MFSCTVIVSPIARVMLSAEAFTITIVCVPITNVQEGNVCMVLSLSQFAGWLMKALAVLEVRVVRQKQKQGIFE